MIVSLRPILIVAWPCLLTLALVLSLASLTRATEREPVAYIEWYEAPAKHYRIYSQMSGTDAQDVYHLRPLYEGDRLKIEQHGVIQISFMGGGSKTLRAEGGLITYNIAVNDADARFDRRGPAGKGASFVAAVVRVLSPHQEEDQMPPVGMRVRSGDVEGFDLPLLDHDRLRVAEGKRNVTLTWWGGEAPFEVRLLEAGATRPALQVAGLKERRLPPQSVSLSKGRYRIEIKDADGKTVWGEFDVVDRSAVPRPPVNSAAMPSEVRATVDATWLANHDGGVWAFESYLGVVGLAPTYPPAQALATMLAAGDIPVL
jgi:hypothetical protein